MNEALTALQKIVFRVEAYRVVETGELIFIVNGADTRMN